MLYILLFEAMLKLFKGKNVWIFDFYYLQNIFFLIIYTVDIPDYCQVHLDAVLPDPANCGHFFNCRYLTSHRSLEISECQYPDLFSVTTRKCEPFTNVQCQNRYEPQAPCKSYNSFLNVEHLFLINCSFMEYLSPKRFSSNELINIINTILLSCLSNIVLKKKWLHFKACSKAYKLNFYSFYSRVWSEFISYLHSGTIYIFFLMLFSTYLKLCKCDAYELDVSYVLLVSHICMFLTCDHSMCCTYEDSYCLKQHMSWINSVIHIDIIAHICESERHMWYLHVFILYLT